MCCLMPGPLRKSEGPCEDRIVETYYIRNASACNGIKLLQCRPCCDTEHIPFSAMNPDITGTVPTFCLKKVKLFTPKVWCQTLATFLRTGESCSKLLYPGVNKDQLHNTGKSEYYICQGASHRKGSLRAPRTTRRFFSRFHLSEITAYLAL